MVARLARHHHNPMCVLGTKLKRALAQGARGMHGYDTRRALRIPEMPASSLAKERLPVAAVHHPLQQAHQHCCVGDHGQQRTVMHWRWIQHMRGGEGHQG